MDPDSKAGLELKELRKLKSKATRQLSLIRKEKNILNRKIRYCYKNEMDFSGMLNQQSTLRDQRNRFQDEVNLLEFKINLILSAKDGKDFKIEHELELSAQDFLSKKGFSVEKTNIKLFLNSNQSRTFIIGDDTGRKYAHCYEIFYAPELIRETSLLIESGIQNYNYYQALCELEKANVDLDLSLTLNHLHYLDNDSVSGDEISAQVVYDIQSDSNGINIYSISNFFTNRFNL